MEIARGWNLRYIINRGKAITKMPDQLSDYMEEGSGFLGNEECNMNYTYIVSCRDGSLYTGWTKDLERRIRAHNEGKGAKYTKSRRPVKLVYYEEFETKKEAMRREYEIKQLTRKEKEQLIRKIPHSGWL